jgi:predicted DNA-binding protein (UPF0251 family)
VTPLVIAVPISGVVAAACFPVCRIAWRNKQYLETFLISIVFVCFAIFSLGASLDCAGAGLDNKVAEAKSKNLPAQLANDAHKRALKALSEAQERANTECATGRKTKCADREAELSEARKQVSEAEKALLQTGGVPKAESAMASRVEYIAPTIKQETVLLVHPLTLAIGLWVAGIAFIGVGFAPPAPEKRKEIKPDLPFEVKVMVFMEENKVTQKEAAEHFGVSPATLSRKLKPLKQMEAQKLQKPKLQIVR